MEVVKHNKSVCISGRHRWKSNELVAQASKNAIHGQKWNN